MPDSSTSICLGEILDKVCQIENCYCLLKVVINKHIEKLEELKGEFEGYEPDEYLPEKFNDAYFSIVYHLRKEINGVLVRKLDEEMHCIPPYDQAFVLNFGHEKICFVVPSFLAMKHLQKTDKCNELLFYKHDPTKTVYAENSKLSIDKVSGEYVYPCWYYIHEDKVTTNYTYISDHVYGDCDYFTMDKYRLLLHDDLEESCRKSVEAYGKYKFRFNREESDKKIDDYDPKDQGVENGLYSFAESLDRCHDIECGKETVCNTIFILECLAEFICDYLEEIEEIKEKIVIHAHHE